MANEDKPNERKQAKRDQILNGAQKIFLAKGFAATSTDQIANEAGISKQTLYAYYASKEELLRAVLSRLLEQSPQSHLVNLTEGGQQYSSWPELRQDFISLAQTVVSGIMQPEYIALLRLIIAEAQNLPNLTDLLRQTLPQRGLQIIQRMLQQAHTSGWLYITDTDAASRLFIGPLMTYTVIEGLLGGSTTPQPPAPERIEQIMTFFFKAFAV